MLAAALMSHLNCDILSYLRSPVFGKNLGNEGKPFFPAIRRKLPTESGKKLCEVTFEHFLRFMFLRPAISRNNGEPGSKTKFNGDVQIALSFEIASSSSYLFSTRRLV